MDISIIEAKNREEVNNFIKNNWFSTDMVIRGQVYDLRTLDGFVVYERDVIIGLVTYKIEDDKCEIMSLDSLKEKQGIGTALIDKVIKLARDKKCKKVKLITTNDNINGIRFYQKRGFDMVKLYCNSVDISRKLKPSIPLFGEFDIPIKHEIEFEISCI